MIRVMQYLINIKLYRVMQISALGKIKPKKKLRILCSCDQVIRMSDFVPNPYNLRLIIENTQMFFSPYIILL